MFDAERKRARLDAVERVVAAPVRAGAVAASDPPKQDHRRLERQARFVIGYDALQRGTLGRHARSPSSYSQPTAHIAQTAAIDTTPFTSDTPPYEMSAERRGMPESDVQTQK